MVGLQEALNQAWSIHQSGDVDGAESIYRQILAQIPNEATTLVYLGIAMFDKRRFQESVDAYRKAIKIQRTFPIAWNNLGNSLRMLGEIEEADKCLQTSMEQKPDYLSPYKNRGTLWIWAGEVERGLRWYHEALRLVPNDPELHRNLGVIYLLQEKYDPGWKEYRWRWTFAGSERPNYPYPVWQGEDVAGKTILLYPEQGLGDAIQFVRVAAVLKQAGANVVAISSFDLLPLMSSAPGVDQWLPEGVQLTSPIDYHASYIDVVDHWFESSGKLATAADVIPLDQGYLSVSESLIEYWKHRLPGEGKRRIGICWQGNPKHHADIYRSVPLSVFQPLAQRDDVQLVSLQFGFGSEQIAESSFADRIHRLPSDIDQSAGKFLDTAAIMKNLDLVVTTDTSTAHLAGALGIPVWLMLGRVPDWRWLEQGDRTQWYPSFRLFRQTQMGDWDSVMMRIDDELSRISHSKSIS